VVSAAFERYHGTAITLESKRSRLWIHWPDIDEDLGTEGLLRGAPAAAEPFVLAARRVRDWPLGSRPQTLVYGYSSLVAKHLPTDPELRPEYARLGKSGCRMAESLRCKVRRCGELPRRANCWSTGLPARPTSLVQFFHVGPDFTYRELQALAVIHVEVFVRHGVGVARRGRLCARGVFAFESLAAAGEHDYTLAGASRAGPRGSSFDGR